MKSFFTGILVSYLISFNEPIPLLVSFHILQIYIFLKHRATNLVIQKRLLYILTISLFLSVFEHSLWKYLKFRSKLLMNIGTLLLFVSSVLLQYNSNIDKDISMVSFYVIGHCLFLNSIITMLVFGWMAFNYHIEMLNRKMRNRTAAY